ncbi:MAG: PD-(D/E)XK nuclease family protein [Pirellulales bacterium]
MAETLRNCPLQAAFSRIRPLRSFVLGNPKAWLGTAYHEVLEKLCSPTEEGLSDDELIERLWEGAIETLRQQATGHALDRRFVESEKWPGYYLARACVQVRAKQALAELPRDRASCLLRDSPTSATMRERTLSAMNGKLVGKPDVVLAGEIHDYKSGKIFEDTCGGPQVAKQSYVRQLCIYGHLVHVNTGQCPRKAKLLPMQGETVEIDLDPDACRAAAKDAVNLLDAFNERLATGSGAGDLATPSPTACRWCQFKAICPAFWNNVEENWAGDLGTAAVRGVLASSPTIIHNGRAFSVTVRATAGTVAAGELAIAPLDKTVHDLNHFRQGDAVRIVNIYRRSDGQLAPTAATLCIRECDCPSFVAKRAETHQPPAELQREM